MPPFHLYRKNDSWLWVHRWWGKYNTAELGELGLDPCPTRASHGDTQEPMRVSLGLRAAESMTLLLPHTSGYGINKLHKHRTLRNEGLLADAVDSVRSVHDCYSQTERQRVHSPSLLQQWLQGTRRAHSTVFPVLPHTCQWARPHLMNMHWDFLSELELRNKNDHSACISYSEARKNVNMSMEKSKIFKLYLVNKDFSNIFLQELGLLRLNVKY